MKVTNFGPDGLPIALAGWSTGVVSLNSNVEIIGGGPQALNFVQRITSNSSNTLLNPIVNFAAGSNIALSASSNTITITGAAAAGGGGGSTTITTKDEGTTLSTTVTTLDFVGAGVTASGAGATTTVTIPGSSGGDLVLLEQHTASTSATLDFTTFISSTYDTYRIVGIQLVPDSNGAAFELEVGTGGGPTWDTGNNYRFGSVLRTAGTSTGFGADTGIAQIANNVSSSGYCAFELVLGGPQSTSQPKTFIGTNYELSNEPKNYHGAVGITWVTAGTAISGLRFLFSAGNIVSGTIRIYGMTK